MRGAARGRKQHEEDEGAAGSGGLAVASRQAVARTHGVLHFPGGDGDQTNRHAPVVHARQREGTAEHHFKIYAAVPGSTKRVR